MYVYLFHQYYWQSVHTIQIDEVDMVSPMSLMKCVSVSVLVLASVGLLTMGLTCLVYMLVLGMRLR